MTHFNHDYTGESPNAVGDRYYAQDLNDDFNYIKHLPYEMIYKGKNGVIIHPTYEYDDSAKTYTFRGGVGAYNTACTVVDTSKTWTIPPAVKSEMRYERVEFKDSVVDVSSLTNTMAFLVVSPTKKSLLSRTKALVATPYETRINYEGQITIATSVSADQIVLGLVSNDSIMLYSPVQNKKNTIMLDVCDCRMTNFETSGFINKISEPFGWTATTDTAIECADIRFEYDIPIEIPLTLKNSVVTGGLATVSRAENCDFSKCTVGVVYGGECINCNIRNISSSESSDSGMFKNCQIRMTAGTMNLVGIFINCNIDCHDAAVYPDSKFMNCRIVAISLIQDDGYSGSTFIGCDIDCSNAPYDASATDISLYSTLERCTIQAENNIELYNYQGRYIDSCEIRCNRSLNIDGTTAESSRIKVTNSHFYTLYGITAKGDYYINCTFEETHTYGNNISFTHSKLDHCTIISWSSTLKNTMLNNCYCTNINICTSFSSIEDETPLMEYGVFSGGSWIHGDEDSTGGSMIASSSVIFNTRIYQSAFRLVNMMIRGDICLIDAPMYNSTIYIQIRCASMQATTSSLVREIYNCSIYIPGGEMQDVVEQPAYNSFINKRGTLCTSVCAGGAFNTSIVTIGDRANTALVGKSGSTVACIGVVANKNNTNGYGISKDYVLNGSNWSQYDYSTKRWLTMDKTARAVVS